MRFSLTFKTPDVIDQLQDECDPEAMEKVHSFLERFVEFGELITIGFDTDAQTATVRET